jgi:predicted DNA-binding helix-hairpin-helix protein
MEKLADGLQKLSEDDLLHVVTMVHDNKTSETYTKNDVESTQPQICKQMRRIKHQDNVLTIARWRVPRRPLHPAGLACQDVVGLHSEQDRVIDTAHRVYRQVSRSIVSQRVSPMG